MEVTMMFRDQHEPNNRELERSISRRRLLTWSGTALLSGIAGCSSTDSPGNGTGSPAGSPSPPVDSVFEDVGFAGPNLVVTLAEDHDVDRLNLIAPDGSTFRQTAVAEGATTAELQILFKSGGSYDTGEYELVAVKGESTDSMAIELRPEINVVDVEPELDEDDRNSTGRLFVTVENTGSGPTWVYNIGFRNAPYANAPDVIEGNGVVDTKFERPQDPQEEFLQPNEEQRFLKGRGVLIISDDDAVSCEGGTVEITIVVQTPHEDIEQPIRAGLSGGYHIDDQAAIQHPCKNIDIVLLSGGGDDA
ncbi:hypothetical protein [Halorarum halobium]|uniref:hypothetical protein n=1 Tax=Halorarum halobium TaxID=3075121 RepID=UPI0028B24239|nr:hypothetical protein [Halobaculum sp. XH14]